MTNHKTTPCKACGAPIIWIEDQNGTKLPVNKEGVRVYRFGVVDNVYFDYLIGSDKPRLAHIDHSITCPGASEFSQGRKK